MNNIFIGLSTNLGDRTKNLETVIEQLQNHDIKILQESSIYETEPCGITEKQQDYYNQCLEINTELTPEKLHETLQSIELTMGRTKPYKYAPRIIDFDILFYNNQIIETDNLTIPHPLITKRNFVLAPLAEIANNFVHPTENKTIPELLGESLDPLTTKKL